MRRRRLVAWLGLALAVAAAAVSASENRTFDFYLLALSWSPTYCGSPVGEADGSQCGGGKRFAFIVHGLWPQYQSGWPEFCSTGEDSVPEETIAEMLPIMPSPQLIMHQWRKHGSCSGLTVEEYFSLTRALLARVRIPARYLSPTAPIVTSPRAVISDFVKSNRGLDPSMISLRCTFRRRQTRLSEVRLCFAPDGSFVSCGSNVQQTCKAPSLILPPVRATARSAQQRWSSRWPGGP